MNKRSITFGIVNIKYIFDTQTGLMKQCSSNLIHSNFDNKFVFIRLSKALGDWLYLFISLALGLSLAFSICTNHPYVRIEIGAVCAYIVHMFRCYRVLLHLNLRWEHCMFPKCKLYFNWAVFEFLKRSWPIH